jgi:hypothetical protein
MRQTLSTSLLVISLALTSTGLATSDSSPNTNTSTNSSAASTSQNSTSNKDSSDSFVTYCPEPDQLSKNSKTMTWVGPTGWKSFEQSFATKLTLFTVAQWQGVNVGQVTCVYRGTPKSTFPVMVYYSVLSVTPKGGKWKAQKGHYSNCASNNVKDCPITVRKKPKKHNIYNELEMLKKTAPNPGTIIGENN